MKQTTSLSLRAWQLLIATTLFFSFSGNAEKTLTYSVKQFSGFGHRMLGDDGHLALFRVPLTDAGVHLEQRYAIQRSTVRRLHERKIPGRTILRGISHMIFLKDGKKETVDPYAFFGAFEENTPHTYAIVNRTLSFTESSSNPALEKVKDFFSKHYMISGMSKHVRFAGEFFVHKNPDNGEIFLVFDNASGTYRPDSAALPALQQLLEANLGDTNVFVYAKAFDQKVDMERLFDHEQDCFYKVAP